MGTMRYILAIDPGGTTGYCHGEYNGEKLVLKPGQEKFSGSELFGFLRDSIPHPDEGSFTLIYESFAYRNRARAGLDLTPPELIGIIKMFAEYEQVDVYEQTPGMAKGFWTDERLKQYSVYIKGLQHGRDAMRHLLQWWQFRAGYQYHEISPFTAYEVIK